METFYNRKQIYMKNRKVIILLRLEQTVGNMQSYENQCEFAIA